MDAITIRKSIKWHRKLALHLFIGITVVNADVGACNGSATAAVTYYRQQFPYRRHSDKRVIQRTEQRLIECSSFHDYHKSGSRKRSVNLDTAVLNSNWD